MTNEVIAKPSGFAGNAGVTPAFSGFFYMQAGRRSHVIGFAITSNNCFTEHRELI